MYEIKLKLGFRYKIILFETLLDAEIIFFEQILLEKLNKNTLQSHKTL